MNASAEALTEPRPLETAPPPPARIAAALTRAESRRLVNHPVFLSGVGLSVVAFVASPDVKPADVGFGFIGMSATNPFVLGAAA